MEPNTARSYELDDGDRRADQHADDDRDLDPDPERVQACASIRSMPFAVTVVTGTPSPAALCGRSSLSHFDTFVGSVEMISSSKPCRLSASWIAASGSCTPTIGSTGLPAASSSSGSASSIVASASDWP